MRETRKNVRRQNRIENPNTRPIKRPDEVFLTGGKKYHTGWCNCVNGVWLSGSNAIKVVSRDKVGNRTLCGLCRNEGQSVEIEYRSKLLDLAPDLLAALEKMWDWQGEIQECFPDELADFVIDVLDRASKIQKPSIDSELDERLRRS